MGLALKVLCLNAGSSSLKLALVEVDGSSEVRRKEGEGTLGDGGGRGAGPRGDDVEASLREALDKAGVGLPDAIGHRLVHGGPDQTKPLRLNPDGRALLEKAVPFAPLHLPSELLVVDAAARLYPGVPQVACFDTAFHATLPEVAKTLPIAAWAGALGVRRYGFHGLSCESIVNRLGAGKLGACVIAHLGSGASMTAVRDGVSVDTSMGMSPSGGIVMATRSGDLDPGALIYLLQTRNWAARELEHFVNHESGLLGVSTTTADMRALLEARDHDPRARLAVDLFVYSARKMTGALAAALGGLQSLVFTGGIGAASAVVRTEITNDLAFLGVSVDPDRNAKSESIVSPDGSPCTVYVQKTDEEVVIARHVREAVG